MLISAPPLDAETGTDEMLVAALLARDGANTTARAAANLLLAAHGLAGLARLDEHEIEEFLIASRLPRAGSAARTLAAAFELGRRTAAADAAPPVRFSETRDVAAWAQPRLRHLVHEELWVLALDGCGGLRSARCVAKGGIHGIGVRSTDPLRIALRTGASGFALVHNHPSGDPSPSTEDVIFTRRIADAARTIGLPLLDHVIVTRDSFASVSFEDGGAA